MGEVEDYKVGVIQLDFKARHQLKPVTKSFAKSQPYAQIFMTTLE